MNPCDICTQAVDCGLERKACYAFALYVNDGGFRHESVVPRYPSRSVYARIMWFDDDTLIRQINRELKYGIFNKVES